MDEFLLTTKEQLFHTFVTNENANFGQAFAIENIWFGIYMGVESYGPNIYEGKGLFRKKIGTDIKHSLIRFRCYKKLIVGEDRAHTYKEKYDVPEDMTFCVSDIGVAYMVPNHILDA